MKKILLAAAFAVATIGMTNAQDLSYGVKGGLNLATLGGDAEDVSSLTSFHFGGFAQIGISDEFMVQPELIFSAQGAVDSEDSDFKQNLSYLNIPIMAKYMVADGLSLEAGPQIGVLISAEATDGNDDVDISDNLNTIDFGVGVGAGYEMESGLMFSLRYNLGLSNILTDDAGGADNSITNNVIQLSVGYKFN